MNLSRVGHLSVPFGGGTAAVGGDALVRASDRWPRWICASVNRHVHARRRGLPMFVEGDDHREEKPAWVEVRVDGPYTREPSKGYFVVEVEVNVLISTSKRNTDLYAHQRNVGAVHRALLAPIKVLKLGDSVGDDGTLLGCLTLVRSLDQREALRVSNFGQLDAVTPLMRSSVEGHFHMQLHG